MTDPWAAPDPDDRAPYFVTPGEYAAAGRLVPLFETREQRRNRMLAAFFGPALLLPLLGAPVALLWRAITPVVGITRTASGPEPAAGESDQFFAIEGWFVVTTILVGVVLGVVAWRFLQNRGPTAALGLAAGGVMASGVTAIVGSRLVVDSYMYGFCHEQGVTCSVYDGTMTLRAPGSIVAWPVAMLLSFAVLTLLRDRG